MIAMPKALAMANPTNITACVATVAGVIASKFAIDAVANTTQSTVNDIEVEIKRPKIRQTEDRDIIEW